MLLSEYLADLTATIAEYEQTGLIVSSDVVTDFRTEKIGFVKGSIMFLDGSVLFFKEYIDGRYRIEKQTYSFHYQDPHNTLLFRYDNAFHRPALEYEHHKHIGEEIITSHIPNLQESLEEIVRRYLA